ncbi:MAG: DUF4395 domain-containing protein [Sphingobacteriia bacterium]|nr:DUF4395 domain-containing protein [Sphingobacteriia bacterium]
MPVQIECPVDFVVTNENKVRLNALWVLILSIVYLFTNWWIIPAFLSVDFYCRGFGKAKLSLISLLSETTIKTLKIAHKPIDQAPKIFAAKVGFLFSIVAAVTQIIGFSTAALVSIAVMSFFAFLESVFKICAGCYVYTFYIKFIQH